VRKCESSYSRCHPKRPRFGGDRNSKGFAHAAGAKFAPVVKGVGCLEPFAKILGFLRDGDVSPAVAYTQALIQKSSDIDDDDDLG